MSIKDKITKYFEETAIEIKKLSIPSKQEIISSTIIVVVTSVVISTFIFGIDRLLSKGIEIVLG